MSTPLQSLIGTSNTGIISKRVEEYDHIDLTDEEREDALRLARRQKHYMLERRKYQEELRKTDIIPSFTAEQVFEILQNSVTYNDRKFLLQDKEYVRIAKQLCCYFTADTRFEGDLKKGLALFGATGVGKTALMKFFHQNQVYSYRVKSMLEINKDYKQGGEAAIDHYNANLQGVRNAFGMTTFGLCIDEVGVEEIPAQHFAQVKHVFAEIIQMRSLNVKNHSTHLTTNLDVKDFEGMYGSRVYDRMKEMFNIIVFNGIKSFRQ